MGYELYREVLDHAPEDLTPAERLVLAVIADLANDGTRLTRSSNIAAWIAHRAGMKTASVSKTLQRLAHRGIELRVAVGTGRDGRPVYAHEGRQTTYRIPILPRRELPQRADSGPHSLPTGQTTVRPLDAKRADHGRKRADHGPAEGGPWSAPAPQGPSEEPSSPARSRAASLIAAAGAADDETEIVIRKIKAENPSIRSLDAYVAKLADTGDLAELVATVRADRRRVDIAEQIASARRGPQCIHGDPGGASLHPTSGLPLCALCRAATRRAAS